jgi:hypothetical protein
VRFNNYEGKPSQNNKKREVQKGKEVIKMTDIRQTEQQGRENGETANGKRKSRRESGSNSNKLSQDSTAHFDPSRYMIKLPKRKKLELPGGQVKWLSVEADYLPVAARIAWFRKEHPDWTIITREIKSLPKATVMKATAKDASGRVIATARRRPSSLP